MSTDPAIDLSAKPNERYRFRDGRAGTVVEASETGCRVLMDGDKTAINYGPWLCSIANRLPTKEKVTP